MCKIFKKLLSIILVLMLLPISNMRVAAVETYQYGYMRYTISENDEITITKVLIGGKHTIPSEINGLPVTTIGKYAFPGSVEEVFIPNSVSTIEYGAFYGCGNLVKVTIEDPVAHPKKGLLGLTQIGVRAFFACEALENIVLPKTVRIIDEEAFSKCSSLRKVVLPYGIGEIRDYAFSYCPKLSKLIVPKSIYILDKSVYAYSGLVTWNGVGTSGLYYGGENLTLTDNHQLGTKLYQYRANYCYSNYEEPELWEFTVMPEEYSDGVVSRICCCGERVTASVPNLLDSTVWKKTYKAPTCAEEGEEIYTSTTYGTITNVVSPTGRHSWGEPSIVDAENAAKDYIYTCSVCDDKMTERKWAFDYVLEDQTMETIQIIGLKDSSTYSGILRIPSEIDGYKVTSIYELPELNHITRVEVGENVERIYEGAFSGSLNIQEIILPDTIKYISDNAFENCISLKEINIPNSVTYLGKEVFKNCTSLKNIEIPGSVENILESTFYGCQNLETVILNEGIITIGSSAFNYCKKVTSVSLPDGLTSIEMLAFANCTALKELSMPEGISNIDSLCFSGSGIEYFRLPASITDFSDFPGYVFSNCSNCKGIYLDENNPSFFSDENGVLYDKDKTRLLYYPAGSEMKEYIVPEGVTEIVAGAFGGESTEAPPAHNLKKIVLPSTLNSVGEAAFWATTGLETTVYNGIEDEYMKINISSYENDNLVNSKKIFNVQEIVKENAKTPVANVIPGTVNVGTMVTLSTETEGATIYYTTDGSTPTKDSAVYTQPIAVNIDITIKAFAVKDGKEDSPIATYTYTTAKADKATISVSDKKGKAGDVISLSLDVSNNPGIAGMILKLSYDEELTLTNIAVSDALSMLTFTPPANVSKNPCTLLWDGMTADNTNGTVLTLTFKISDEASEGEYNVKVSYATGDIYDDNMIDIDLQIDNGVVTVVKYKTGDVNEDDVINAKDITMLRKFISGDYGVTINEGAADVNKDGILNAKDITILRKHISGDYGIVLD